MCVADKPLKISFSNSFLNLRKFENLTRLIRTNVECLLSRFSPIVSKKDTY